MQSPSRFRWRNGCETAKQRDGLRNSETGLRNRDRFQEPKKINRNHNTTATVTATACGCECECERSNAYNVTQALTQHFSSTNLNSISNIEFLATHSSPSLSSHQPHTHSLRFSHHPLTTSTLARIYECGCETLGRACTPRVRCGGWDEGVRFLFVTAFVALVLGLLFCSLTLIAGALSGPIVSYRIALHCIVFLHRDAFCEVEVAVSALGKDGW